MKNEKNKFHPCIHTSMYGYHHIGSKRNHNMSYIIKSSIILHKIIENPLKKKKSTMIICCVSLTNVRHSRGVCRHFKSKIQVLLLYIRTLYKAMVIDFLMFTSRPSTRQWLLISFLYIEALCKVMVIDFLLYIKTLCEAMVIDFLMSHRGPLRGNGHRSLYIKTLCKAMVIDFLCHIEALCEAMVIDLFTSRSSTR